MVEWVMFKNKNSHQIINLFIILFLLLTFECHYYGLLPKDKREELGIYGITYCNTQWRMDFFINLIQNIMLTQINKN